MKDAAKEAGMFKEDYDIPNFIVLESEAASIYFLKSPQAYLEIKDSEEPFIVCNFGGEALDIITHRKIRTYWGFQFIEEYPPLGGNFGYDSINKFFIDRIIKDLFGEKCFNEAKNVIWKNSYNDWI